MEDCEGWNDEWWNMKEKKKPFADARECEKIINHSNTFKNQKQHFLRQIQQSNLFLSFSFCFSFSFCICLFVRFTFFFHSRSTEFHQKTPNEKPNASLQKFTHPVNLKKCLHAQVTDQKWRRKSSFEMAFCFSCWINKTDSIFVI